MPNTPTIVEKVDSIDQTIGYAEGILKKYEMLFDGNIAFIAINVASIIGVFTMIVGGMIYLKYSEGKLSKQIKEEIKITKEGVINVHVKRVYSDYANYIL